MLFNSIQYLIFLPSVFVLYFAIPARYRWILLLTASYYFYMCWKVEYVILIIISTLIDYYSAIKIYQSKTPGLKRAFLYFSLTTNLGILFFYKYFNFAGNSLNSAFRAINLQYEMPYFDILLPVGISFYTFQKISYIIDVYEEKREPERHPGIFAVFVAFFPQLVAGPIERSTRLIPQFHKKISFSYANVSAGVKLIIWGFFLKLVVADRAALYVNAVYNNVDEHSGLTFIAATILYSFQIYGDFAGYSCIAIGSSRLFGIDLMMNFNRPYFAASVQEFWKRWHISLSTWLCDYIYTPLSIYFRDLKLKGIVISIILTFLVSGLWHGANWTFIIWGALHGLYLIIDSLLGSKRKKGIINILITFAEINFAFIFFRANSLADAFHIIQIIIARPGKLFIPSDADVATPIYAAFAIGLLMLIEFKKEYFDQAFSIANSRYEAVRMFAYASLVFLIFYIGVFGGSQFIYFQF